VRFPYHGGLTPAALVNERSCIAQVAVSPANVRIAGLPRAGGVSTPWHASILVRQQTLGAASTIPEPRRADGRASSFGSRCSPKIVRYALQARTVSEPRRADGRRSRRTCVCAPRMSLFFSEPASYTTSAWRKPAVGYHPIVRGERNHSTKTDRHCRCDSRSTAGSRPPLLLMRVCASQKSLFRRRTFARQHKSGGR
jgi:hypothetical protein